MSNRDLSSRNRKNAQHSTGPKTAEGKKKVAQNARRHGATARATQTSTVAWLRVIANDPHISLSDVTDGGDRYFRAFALAEAEARLRIAQDALTSFEIEAENRLGEIKETLRASSVSNRRTSNGPQDFVEHDASVPRRYQKEITELNKTKRLLERYLSEAKSHRKKAFGIWIETLQQL